jgi:hypothetical protein
VQAAAALYCLGEAAVRHRILGTSCDHTAHLTARLCLPCPDTVLRCRCPGAALLQALCRGEVQARPCPQLVLACCTALVCGGGITTQAMFKHNPPQELVDRLAATAAGAAAGKQAVSTLCITSRRVEAGGLDSLIVCRTAYASGVAVILPPCSTIKLPKVL